MINDLLMQINIKIINDFFSDVNFYALKEIKKMEKKNNFHPLISQPSLRCLCLNSLKINQDNMLDFPV